MLTQHGINSLPSGSSLDPDIVILQDWMTRDVGLQPSSGTVPAASFDADGPLDVSGTGWSGTPYMRQSTLGLTDARTNQGSYSTNFTMFAAQGLVYAGVRELNLCSSGIPFTLEMWLRRVSERDSVDSFNYTPIVGLFNDSDDSYYNTFSFGWKDVGVSYFDKNGRHNSVYATPLNEWHHYALVVDGDRVTEYIDGIGYPAINLYINPMEFFSICKRARVSWAGSWSYFVDSDIAQLCLTKRAKWTSNFTPPRRPYCLGAENL